MDEILYLEPDEEITSVIDKIKNAHSSKLGLVVPRDATLLQSVVNLKLLSKEATSLGKEIAIVTTDRIGRNLAAQVGIPVFNSIEEQKPIFQPQPPKPSPEEIIELDTANQAPIEQPKDVQVHHFQEKPLVWRRKEAPILKPQFSQKPEINTTKSPVHHDYSKLRKIIWPILAIILVLSLIAGYLLLPRATAKVFVLSEDLKKTVDVTATSKTKTEDLTQSVFPGELIESQKEKQEKFSTTGKKTIGTKASGTITLYNEWDSNPHNLSAGTKLSSLSKTFLTKSDVSIPAFERVGGNDQKGSVKVDIEAENPGEDYNVKAGRFTILGLPAAQQEKIYGQSNSDLTGGESREVQVISQEDYDKAKFKLVEGLNKEIAADFLKKTSGKKIVEKAIVKPDPDISSPKVDSEAKDFEMKVSLKEQVIIFDSAKFKDFLVKILTKQAPVNKMVTIAKDEDIGYEVTKTAYDKGELDLKVNILAKISDKISTDKIKSEIIGKNLTDAENIIKNTPGVSKVEITMSPSWWFKKIPNFEKNVEVEIQYMDKK